MKYVTITIGGIIQSVPEADVAQYLRAGYSVVEQKPAPKSEPKSEPDPAPVVDPKQVEAAEKTAPRKSK